MIDGVDNYWIWVALGLALAALELLAPGVYLIWLAVAALATGGLAFLFDFGWPFEIISFVSLSLIAVYSARRYLSYQPIVSSDPLLNQRGGRMVGETALVVQPIESGSGRVRLVRIGDVDLQPCGGTHVSRTSEIGPLIVTKIEKKGRQNRRVRIQLAD